jgi:lauroyl/myristoyl acyltransferase
VHSRDTLTVETSTWRPEGLVSLRDVVIAGRLACCYLCALVLRRHWYSLAELMARLHLLVSRRSLHLFQKSTLSKNELDRLSHEAIAAQYVFQIQAMRETLPGGWQTDFTLTGQAVLDDALKQSRGAILWCSPFVGAELLPKKALAARGYQLTQLSTRSHPFSSTQVGTRLLNPIWVRMENRYLARRVLVVYGQSKTALQVLREVLGKNGVVLIMAIGSGKRSYSFPFMGGVIELAVGAPRLAYDTKAALIPLFTLPNKNGGYRIELGRNLTLDSLPKDEALLQMARSYVAMLEPFVTADPAHWEGWFHPDTWRCS